MTRKVTVSLGVTVLAASALSGAMQCQADISSSGPGGFVTKSTVMVSATPAAAYQRFLQIGSWWNPEHTYTQDGRNLTLKAEPGGCLCESLKDGGFVEHLRVIFASPGRLLRLQGGLGPLQDLGATGALSVSFEAVDAQTRVTLPYAVTGYRADKGLAELAAPVDGVLTEQLQRYKKAADSP